MPSFSAASIIARPMRSLTLLSGLKNSSFTSTVAAPAGTMRFSLTSGVLNVVSTMLLNVLRWDMAILLEGPGEPERNRAGKVNLYADVSGTQAGGSPQPTNPSLLR